MRSGVRIGRTSGLRNGKKFSEPPKYKMISEKEWSFIWVLVFMGIIVTIILVPLFIILTIINCH